MEVSYDRAKELKAFDETKAGVKGLVDGGISVVPRMFIKTSYDLGNDHMNNNSQLKPPVIDLHGLMNRDVGPVRRKAIVEKVREAAETWGFFTVVNHGIPESVLEEMIDGIRRFHEQDSEMKKEFYTRDITSKVIYTSNFTLYTSRSADWKDSLYCLMAPNPPDPRDLPATCRYASVAHFLLQL